MPSYTYTGSDIEFLMRGVHFPQGEAVEINDPGFEAKLDNLPYFTSDKPKPKATTVVALRDEEIEGYQRHIAGLEAENATLRKRISELEGADPEPIVAVEPDEEPEVVETYTPNEQEAAVEIPEDWRDMHWKRQMVLAKKFTDMEIENQADAVTAIELELERRGN